MSNDLIPAGEYFCRRCFTRRDFVLGEDAQPEDKEPPIECYVCGYTYARIHVEVDPVTGFRIAPNLTVRSAMPHEHREVARIQMREKFKSEVLKDGYRMENFTLGPARRRSDT